MDLLDSILSKMEKPPSVDDKRKKQLKGKHAKVSWLSIFSYHVTNLFGILSNVFYRFIQYEGCPDKTFTKLTMKSSLN